MKTLIAFVPVLHEGYRRFFEKYEGPKELFIVGTELTQEYKPLTKEIRQLDPALMKRAIESLGIFDRVEVLSAARAKDFNSPEKELFLPREDITEMLAEQYFPHAHVTYDPVFLRWDRKNSAMDKDVHPDALITRDDLHRRIMAHAEAASEKTSDIWRGVGATLVKDGDIVLTAYNHHLPSEHSPYVHGDPRNNFSRGDHIEISSAFHAEASLIAEAARRGISLEGASLYVTTFPCPPCSKLIAHSGITTLYYAGGYGVLDGEDILKSAGVQLIKVE